MWGLACRQLRCGSLLKVPSPSLRNSSNFCNAWAHRSRCRCAERERKKEKGGGGKKIRDPAFFFFFLFSFLFIFAIFPRSFLRGEVGLKFCNLSPLVYSGNLPGYHGEELLGYVGRESLLTTRDLVIDHLCFLFFFVLEQFEMSWVWCVTWTSVWGRKIIGARVAFGGHRGVLLRGCGIVFLCPECP